jgi:hypothetical protein
VKVIKKNVKKAMAGSYWMRPGRLFVMLQNEVLSASVILLFLLTRKTTRSPHLIETLGVD